MHFHGRFLIRFLAPVLKFKSFVLFGYKKSHGWIRLALTGSRVLVRILFVQGPLFGSDL